MTRITYSGPSGPDADYELTITGHTNHEACAALSALWYAFTTGIERLATLHPEDVKIFEPLHARGCLEPVRGDDIPTKRY